MKKNSPFFTVIIPVYNRPDEIARSVVSVLSQSFDDYELIVIDDGSTDETHEVLSRLSGEIRIIRQENRGVSSARNAGIIESSGKFIALLDSDDIWNNNKLERQAAFIGLNPGVEIFQCNENWIRHGRRVNPAKKHLKPSGDIFVSSLHLCTVSPSAVVIKKDLFGVFGMFDERMKVCEDYDLWLRISSRREVLLQDEYLLDKTGGHADQLSASCWGMDRFRIFSMIKLLEENRKVNFLDAVRLAEIHEVLFSKLDVMMNGAEKRGKTEFFSSLSEMRNKISSGSCNSKDCLFLLE